MRGNDGVWCAARRIGPNSPLPAPTLVILANAGIHCRGQARSICAGGKGQNEFPEYAGMTGSWRVIGVLPSFGFGLATPLPVIPAKAGIQAVPKTYTLSS
ncbi:hypothetical protein EAO82_11865 [Halopseudomonas pelagia]|uniref:Uncharacterized protein n=1 Tax=Halopseudomonas pelagia TaxID=553151 RepID=A0AA91TZR0_9GAMM|nr:hypothetical protein CO192_17610 [Halopseudomonas pelagia]QFY56999.1 hypothetical protein EAO82_11865 [Halopseudomonas pelagia]